MHKVHKMPWRCHPGTATNLSKTPKRTEANESVKYVKTRSPRIHTPWSSTRIEPQRWHPLTEGALEP